MAAMNGNGTIITEKSRIPLSLVILLLTVIVGAAGFVYSVQAAQQVHMCNGDIHHSVAALDGKYVQQAVLQAKLDDVMRRLDRIENKLDKLSPQ